MNHRRIPTACTALVLLATAGACDKGELLAPLPEDADMAALVLDDGNDQPRVLVGAEAIPVPMQVLEAVPVLPTEATRIRVSVGDDGSLAAAAIVRTSGDADLDRRALDAVRRRTFEPGYPRVFVTSVWVRSSGR